MKARRRVDPKMQERIRNEVVEHFKEQSNEMTRRIMKIFCVALNQEYGFGKDRLMKLIAKVEELSTEREQDEVFWSHVDRYVNEHIGMAFDEENYERMDV